LVLHARKMTPIWDGVGRSLIAMLLILVAVVVGLLVGLAFGGSLRNMLNWQVRWWGLAFVGLGLQAIPVGSRPTGTSHVIAVSLLVVSYVVLLVFVARNLRVAGFAVMGVGFALNALVISLNGGMPVNDHALHTAAGRDYPQALYRLVVRGGAKHHLAGPGDVLLPLSDVIPIGPPFRNVLSVGDLVWLVGTAWVFAEATRAVGAHRAGRADRAAGAPGGAGAPTDAVSEAPGSPE
jgi:hypothetical protein